MSLDDLMAVARPNWFDGAACRGLPPDLFYPEQGGPTFEAMRVCAGCPVKAECADAGRFEAYGIWGGMSGIERRAVRRPRERVIDHGSPNGYEQHRRQHLPMCDACREAHAVDKAIKKNGGVVPDKPDVVNHPEMIGPARRWVIA